MLIRPWTGFLSHTNCILFHKIQLDQIKTTNLALDRLLGAVVEVGDLATAGREGGLAEHAVILVHRPLSALLKRIDKGLDSPG